MLAVLAAANVAGLAAHAAVTLEEYATPIKDVTCQSVIVSRDMDALKKISNEFAQSYRFAESTMYYKEPHKFRVDSKAGIVGVKYVINGNRKVLKAGVINKRWDISKDPGQRQSAITIGLVTAGWAGLLDNSYLGDKTINGTRTVLFESHFKGQPTGSYYKLYIDPERRYVVRSEQFHGDGKLKVSMNFLNPKKVNGHWVPTQTKVYNPQGQLGAVTELRNVRVNSGLDDDLFAL
jgi:outer membrane lipoprotein-sorting protein